MRIAKILERPIAISRYADVSIVSEPLDTSVVAVAVDTGHGPPVTGYGFSSIGRYAQSGQIRERFAPRLLAAAAGTLQGADGHLDPLQAWDCMMKGEKPGGHGERCVAIGALDMALWDAAAKMAGMPLHALLSRRFGRDAGRASVPAYVGGGYYFPDNDIGLLQHEVQEAQALGFTDFKIKVGAAPLARDVERIEAVLQLVGDGSHLAVDAMNRYSRATALQAAAAFAPYGLKWFEDICDPLDYETHACVAAAYAPPIAAGEALFSSADALNLFRYGGLRPRHDILLFDPAHCYGVPEYLRILEGAQAHGWFRTDFWPHGGHLFGLHLTVGLGLGGAEMNPHNFQPFGGLPHGLRVQAGRARPPDAPGIGWETKPLLMDTFNRLAM